MNEKVLVCEEIAASGIDLLQRHCAVELAYDWDRRKLLDQIGDYDALLVRSATRVDADLIAQASKLRVIGRAGIGTDNIDIAAASKRGIVVANAPQSNIVAAAEHTIALMLALVRKIPQAHSSLKSGCWQRSEFAGSELYGKTFAILGFGRIGQLVAERTRAFALKILAYDPYVASDKFRELAVERVAGLEEIYRRAELITLHLPSTDETRGMLDATAFAQMKSGVRIINCARGDLIVESDLKDALDSGKVAGAALDVFGREPAVDNPLITCDNVVVTPHLGASTTEAQDRAGVETAEAIIAAMSGGVVTSAVNTPSFSSEEHNTLQPFLPLCERLGRIAVGIAAPELGIERFEAHYQGAIAKCSTRLLTVAALKGVLECHLEENVNYVNAPLLAEERGINTLESSELVALDFTDLIYITVSSDAHSIRVAGTVLSQRYSPHLLEAWGQRFNLPIDQPYLALFKYRDMPGMVGKVGSVFGEHGINICTAAVGHEPAGQLERSSTFAVMAVTADSEVDKSIIDQITAIDNFETARAITLC